LGWGVDWFAAAAEVGDFPSERWMPVKRLKPRDEVMGCRFAIAIHPT
jgi:hypothetical protein